jgi:hypothetical protein
VILDGENAYDRKSLGSGQPQASTLNLPSAFAHGLHCLLLLRLGNPSSDLGDALGQTPRRSIQGSRVFLVPLLEVAVRVIARNWVSPDATTIIDKPNRDLRVYLQLQPCCKHANIVASDPCCNHTISRDCYRDPKARIHLKNMIGC